MGRLIIFVLLITASVGAWAQTCTMTNASPLGWTNSAAITCAEGGTLATKTTNPVLVIPSGKTLNFASGDNWTGITGAKIIVQGVLSASDASGNRIDASLEVQSGGVILISGKLNLGSSPTVPASCNFNVVIRTGGTINVGGTGSDRLDICGNGIFKGNGTCNNCVETPVGSGIYNCDGISPIYCEPVAGGFTGPLGFDQTGSNSALPIELLYFNVSIPKNENHTLIEWATEDEQDFDHFEIQRAGKDLTFSTILEIPGAGYNTNSLQKYSAYDENPLVGIGYYRLKAVDIDGSYEYFKIKSVNYNGGRRLLVSPNPTSGTSFKYSINFDPGQYDRVVLVNQVGTELFSAPVTGTENELVPDSKLKPGAYLLRYVSPNFQQVARVFIKE